MSQRSRKKNRSAGKMKERVLQPPQIAIVPSIHHTFRFTNGATVTRLSLTFQGLLDLMCVAATATSAYRLWGAVRLRKICIWCTGASSTVPTTIAIQKLFSGASTGANSKLYTDTVLGTAATAFVKVGFDDSEAVGQWQGGGNATASYCNITLPQGSIVDVTLSAVFIEDNLSTAAVTGAVAGATVGQTYVRSLDSPAGTTQLVPVSYFTV